MGGNCCNGSFDPAQVLFFYKIIKIIISKFLIFMRKTSKILSKHRFRFHFVIVLMICLISNTNFIVSTIFFNDQVADHSIRNYVENLEMMIDRKWSLAKASKTRAQKYIINYRSSMIIFLDFSQIIIVFCFHHDISIFRRVTVAISKFYFDVIICFCTFSFFYIVIYSVI